MRILSFRSRRFVFVSLFFIYILASVFWKSGKNTKLDNTSTVKESLSLDLEETEKASDVPSTSKSSKAFAFKNASIASNLKKPIPFPSTLKRPIPLNQKVPENLSQVKSSWKYLYGDGIQRVN